MLQSLTFQKLKKLPSPNEKFFNGLNKISSFGLFFAKKKNEKFQTRNFIRYFKILIKID